VRILREIKKTRMTKPSEVTWVSSNKYMESFITKVKPKTKVKIQTLGQKLRNLREIGETQMRKLRE
jgi:hypothetical protein